MQSNNPVFRRSAAFNGSSNQQYAGQSAYGYGQQAPYGQQQYGQPQYGDPSTWDMSRATGPVSRGRMTIDSVVQKTGITLGVVVLFALATWILTPGEDELVAGIGLGGLYAASLIGAGGAFILSMVNSFKRIVSPGLVIAFAAFEGVALGALSKVFDLQFGGGIVTGAVLGTMAAFAGTLTAYKVLNIQVGQKFRTFVVAAMFGMVGLALMEVVLGLFGGGVGIFGFGAMGLIFSVVGLVLGVFMLIMDFDFVEQGIRFGADERESWRAAFAMTVSLVWIYTNLLRLLAIFQND